MMNTDDIEAFGEMKVIVNDLARANQLIEALAYGNTHGKFKIADRVLCSVLFRQIKLYHEPDCLGSYAKLGYGVQFDEIATIDMSESLFKILQKAKSIQNKEERAAYLKSVYA